MAWICKVWPAAALAAFIVIPAASQDAVENPILVIESFRAAKAYAVGTDPLTLVGTIRNLGKAPLPAESAQGKLISLAGLDLTAGDTLPKIPELATGAAVSYKWQVTPSRPDGPLAASLVIQPPRQPVLVKAFSIPRLISPPPPESPTVAKTPTATAESGVSSLENDRIRARLVNDISRDPILLFSIRTTGGWRQVGASVPLIEIESAESGQRSWREQLNVEEAQTKQSPTDASIRLNGKIGLKWQASLELKLRAGSGALDADVTLTALRYVRPSGIRLLPLLAGEGSFGSAASEVLEPSSGGPTAHRAVRWGEITVGTVRRNETPLAGWQSANLPGVDGADFRLLATEWIHDAPSNLLNPGTAVRLRTRIFALAPSASVRDAHTVAPPESVTQNRSDGQ